MRDGTVARAAAAAAADFVRDLARFDAEAVLSFAMQALSSVEHARVAAVRR